jgi:hypothetical protein
MFQSTTTLSVFHDTLNTAHIVVLTLALTVFITCHTHSFYNVKSTTLIILSYTVIFFILL